MSKRSAEIQGGKDLVGGFGNEMSANPADPPKRATAAQLASRKIKQARQRTRIASPNPASSISQAFASPFTTIDPNIVPPSSSTGTNGFTFGQSQSFPQTGSGSGAPTPQTSFFGDQNNSGPKLFGGQTGSAPSSFSFSASTSEEIRNPFANISSGFGQGQGGFQGFQGNTFNIPGPATTSQDTQNIPGQQAPTGALFGSSQPKPPTTFSFGGSSAPTSTSLFSTAPPASTPASTSAPIFGQSNGNNIFAPSSSSTNIFGASSQASKPSDEMQMSPPSKSNGITENRASQFFVSGVSQPSFTSSVTQPSSFETSAFKPVAPATPSTSQPFSTSIFNATPSGGSAPFGNLKTSEETAQHTPASTAPTTSITNPSPKFSFTPAIAAGSSIFGQTSKPEERTPATAAASAGTAVSSSTPSFSTTFPAASPAPFSLFGTTSKPNEPPPAPSATAAEDTTSSTKSPAPEQPTAPATSLFGPSLFGNFSKPEEPAASPAPSAEGEKAPAEAPSRPPSVTPSASPFPSTAAGGTSLFGRTRETSEPMSIFNTQSTSATPSTPAFSFTPSSTSIFQAPAKTPSAISAEEKIKEGAQGASSLFQTTSTYNSTQSSTSKTSASLPQNKQPTSNIFGSTSASPPPFKSSTAPEKRPSTPPSASTAPPQSFTPTTTPKPSFAGISNSETKITKAMDASPAQITSPMNRKVPKSRLSSYGPPAIPRELNNDERAEFDTEWRLNALNNSFKRSVAEADPESNEIDSLIEFYVKVRQHIGAPMGLAVVPKSGRKRKAVEEETGPGAADFSRSKKTKGLVPSTARHAETDAASFSSSVTDMDGVNSSGEKSASASASAIFSSTASPSGKRKATDIEGDASRGSEPGNGNGNGNGKRSKVAGETMGGGANPFQKSNSEKMEYGNGSGSGLNAASDTVTMFATSFVSQSQKGNSPSGYTGPFSTLSSTQGSVEGTAATSPSSQDSESGNDTESNASAGEEAGEVEGKGGEESESSPTPPATSNGGRSLFDRVELDPSGKPVREGPLPVEDIVTAPSPGEKDSNVSSLFAGSKFASFNSPSSIGTPQLSNGFDFKSPRSVSPVNPSPIGSDARSPPSIFASSTGTSTPNAPALAASTSTSTLFPKVTSSLLPNGSSQTSPFPFSAATSADVSRATTPNLSETGADESEEANEDLPQVDLLRGGTGEEDEDEVFEARVKLMKWATVAPASDDSNSNSNPNPKPQWQLQGVGLLRILKHKTTGRARVLVRADPSGRVLLNANLVAAVNYKSVGSAVQFLVPREPKPEQWIVRVKKEAVAVELAGVMEKYKK
ncbi:hypothetical protein ACJ72_06890 [Emergomyces africanus]|uniref:RanBD1 domain-containing protein n=1 Tax=Emergomyces africanus TaxID=1955775 RepID=A0A1B7NPT8_9EURO|nr:hypothetical protein ACJ72_06890 [Emergomyces africanus]